MPNTTLSNPRYDPAETKDSEAVWVLSHLAIRLKLNKEVVLAKSELFCSFRRGN